MALSRVGLSGLAIAEITAGVILAWSGIENAPLSQTFRDLLGGQKPQPGPATALPAAVGKSTATAQIGGGDTGLPYGTVGTGPAGPGEAAWFTAMLASIGALPTPANLKSLHDWRTRESTWDNSQPDGALYAHNPLNTTLVTSSSVGTVNSIGVQIYGSAAGGIAATAQTLLQGYPAIVSALRRGVGLATGDPAVASELLTWSGNSYSSV